MEALVIGYEEYLSWFMPSLLHRAGFEVDVLTGTTIFNRSRYVRSIFMISPKQSAIDGIIQLLETHKKNYDWIIITEDRILREVLIADIPVALKLRILPVRFEHHFGHLYSKIGLTQVLDQHGISVPSYRIVRSVREALQAAATLGYPVLLKVDASGGGLGVYECQSTNDIKKLLPLFINAPVLIQKKILGEELDLSAIYCEGKLIHFNYAFFRKTSRKFGPSVVRDYHPWQSVEQQIITELQQLGIALGAHGFVNITCIQTADNRRFYFEADMRPNAWLEFPKFLGDDPALKINAWFARRVILIDQIPKVSQQAHQVVRLPHFMHLNIFELAMNKYKVWQYIPYQDKGIIYIFLLRKLRAKFRINKRNSWLKRWVQKIKMRIEPY